MPGKHLSLIFRTTLCVLALLLIFNGPGNVSASDWVQYEDEHWAFKLEYPAGWNLQNNPYHDFGWRISSPNALFDPLGNPTQGGYLSISVVPQSDITTETFFVGTITSTNQIIVSGIPAIETNGMTRDGSAFKQAAFAFDNYSYQIAGVFTSDFEASLTSVEAIIDSFEITGTPVEHPHENNFNEIQSTALTFPAIKHAFQEGLGWITFGYGAGFHTGGDAYALDLIECNGSLYNCGSGSTSQYVLAPTEMKLIWSGNYNNVNNDPNDFHIFEVTYDSSQRLCMSLGHVYIEHPQLTTNRKIPRGTLIGRLAAYPDSIPHIHMGLWTVPISNGCAGGSRTAIPYTGAFSLDGVEYPAGENHQGKDVNSTNIPICAEATTLELSDCWASLSDNAIFVSDVTIPDDTVMAPGQSFTKVWRMKNTGSTTWGSGYSWVFTSGSQMGAPVSVSVPATAPNNTADLSVNMTAPSLGGTYTGYWQMKNPQGRLFGDLVWVRIIVNGPAPTGSWQAKYMEGNSCWLDTNCDQITGAATPTCEENIAGAGLNKDWGANAPCSGMSADNWVANFAGTINFPSENYVFQIQHDDGIKFWLNGEIKGDFGSSGTNTICNGTSGVALSGDEELRILLREETGNAHVSLTWSTDTNICERPTVASIVRISPSPTSAASVDFAVTFSEPVTGVDTTDFSLVTTRVTGASVSSVTATADPAIFTVTINTGSGNGTIRLDLKASGTGIQDTAGNPISGGFTSGETYAIIKDSSFGDVPTSYWAFPFIETIYYSGITSGCGSGNYCPNRSVTRAEMAIFLLRGIHGASYTPPEATGIFEDVSATFWAADWIEQLYKEGITSGCSKSPLLYCPNRSVTRAEMAIFLLRAKYTSSYTPDPVTGAVFDDIPDTFWAGAWVEQLYNEGITSGCSTSPMLYCPNRSITRAEMAIFLTRTFDLTMP